MSGRSDQPTSLGLPEALRQVIELYQARLRVSLPARVERWHPELQAVDVQPLIDDVVVEEEERKPVRLPVVTRVPVQFLRFAGFVIRTPVAVGDHVLLMVADRELTRWLSGDGSRVTPRSDRVHHIDDAVALPGISTWASPIPGLDQVDMVIGREDGSGELRIRPNGEVWLTQGGQQPQPMVLGQTLVDLLSALTVPTAFGPSGPPINAPQFVQMLAAVGRVR